MEAELCEKLVSVNVLVIVIIDDNHCPSSCLMQGRRYICSNF